MSLFDEAEDIERAELYRLFASIFINEPSDEAVAHIKEILQLKSIETPQQIRMDFIRIFSGPSALVMPYESFYNYQIGDIPRLWGIVTEEVQAFYLSTGLVFEEDIELIPDHVSAEFLFMSYLIENGKLDLQKFFIEMHIAKWIPEFCNDLYKHAGTMFYREIADVLKEFVLSEAEEFGVV